MPEILLLRHGQAGDVLGHYDTLSPRGQAQARLAGAALRGRAGFAQVVRGAMVRHELTARAFAEGLGEPLVDPRVDVRWNEFDHRAVLAAAVEAGVAPPASADPREVGRFFFTAFSRWVLGEGEHAEPYEAFHGRVVEGFEALAAGLGPGERALVFTSGGAIAAVCRHALGLDGLAALRVNAVLVNAGFTRVRVGAWGPALVSMNVFTHLESEAGMLTLT